MSLASQQPPTLASCSPPWVTSQLLVRTVLEKLLQDLKLLSLFTAFTVGYICLHLLSMFSCIFSGHCLAFLFLIRMSLPCEQMHWIYFLGFPHRAEEYRVFLTADIQCTLLIMYNFTTALYRVLKICFLTSTCLVDTGKHFCFIETFLFSKALVFLSCINIKLLNMLLYRAQCIIKPKGKALGNFLRAHLPWLDHKLPESEDIISLQLSIFLAVSTK